jgi:hypothetical protein
VRFPLTREVILDHRVVDARNDRRYRLTGGHRLVDDLRHEDRAVLVERDPVRGGQGPLAELHDVVDPGEPLPLLFDEGAGPGAAGLVHRRIDDPASLQPDVLGILAADLEDGVDTPIVVDGAGGMGGDLVEHEDGARAQAIGQQRADHLAAAAGHPDRDYRALRHRSLQQPPHQSLGRVDRIAAGGTIHLPDHITRAWVDRHCLRAG